MAWPLLAAAGVAAAASAFGAYQGNESAQAMSSDTRQWQTMMAATEYKRRMASMRDAGLNPILAYQQGGSGVPGTVGSQVFAPDIGGAASSAVSAMTKVEEAKLLKEQVSTQKSQQALNLAAASKASAETVNTGIQSKLLTSQVPAAMNKMAVDSSALGKASAWLDKVFDTAGRGFSAFGNIFGPGKFIPRNYHIYNTNN